MSETKMSEQEMGRIALKVLKKHLERQSLPSPKDFRSEIKSMARELGETPETMMGFYVALLPQLLGKMLGYQSVGLVLGSPIS